MILILQSDKYQVFTGDTQETNAKMAAEDWARQNTLQPVYYAPVTQMATVTTRLVWQPVTPGPQS